MLYLSLLHISIEICVIVELIYLISTLTRIIFSIVIDAIFSLFIYPRITTQANHCWIRAQHGPCPSSIDRRESFRKFQHVCLLVIQLANRDKNSSFSFQSDKVNRILLSFHLLKGCILCIRVFLSIHSSNTQSSSIQL